MQVAKSLWSSWVFVFYAGLVQAAPTVVPENPKEKKQNKSTMTVFQFGNPLHQTTLNEPTLAVKKLPDPEVDSLLQDMLKMMRKKIGGAGISANQLGKSLQISVVSDPLAFGSERPYTVYINPVITSASRATSCFWHGCLSAEGEKFGKVSTWQTVTVTALDQKGNKFTKELRQLDAIVFQHEFRHLLGGGYQDHSSDFKEERELMKLALEGKLKFIEACQPGEKPLLDDYVIGETIEKYAERKNNINKPKIKTSVKEIKLNDRSENSELNAQKKLKTPEL